MDKIDTTLLCDYIAVLNDFPLLGSLLSSLNRKIDKTCPTLGVNYDVKTDNWNLYINPDFYLKYDQTHRIALLLHEAWHVILLHPCRMKITQKSNIAADIIVNEYIENMRQLFPEACFYEGFQLKKIEDDTFEKVYARLSDQEEKKHGKGKGDLLDKHDWENVPAEAKERSESAMREIVETSIASNPNDFGDLPQEIQRIIKESLRPQVKWNKVLKIYGQSTMKSSRSFSYRKVSRRFGNPLPGLKKKMTGKVLVGVDVSGSVSIECQKQFLGELKSLARYCEVSVAFFDVNIVKYHKHWKEADGISYSGGGTDCNCVYSLAESTKPDAVVILTDGYFGDINTKGFKTLFVITPNGQERKEGQTVRITL